MAEQDAARAITNERLRIARELHDVVSHTISLIGVKAAVARHVAESHPEEVHDALEVIETASREALTEMHRMLGVLRVEGTATRREPHAATEELADVTEDLAHMTSWAADAGVRLELTLRGTDRIPSSLRPSIHRIVQEAVTNAVRYAAPTSCQVLIEATSTEVRVEVIDDGPDDNPGGEGNRRTTRATAVALGGCDGGAGLGLIGMRERVVLHGGEFAAGARPGGGFAVVAQIPCMA